MFYKPMILPMIAMVALTFLVWIYMYVTRLGEIARRKIDPQDLADDHNKGSLLRDSSKVAANLRNLFEMPVLFYLAVLLTLALLIQDPLVIFLSWTYVGLRTLHSFIHCTYNQVTHRFTAYAASCVVLALIWVQLAWYVISS